MIEIKPAQKERIVKVTCDCCQQEIPIDWGGRLPDHMKISGYCKGLLLEAVVCIKCMEEKLSFINIQRNRDTRFDL